MNEKKPKGGYRDPAPAPEETFKEGQELTFKAHRLTVEDDLKAWSTPKKTPAAATSAAPSTGRKPTGSGSARASRKETVKKTDPHGTKTRLTRSEIRRYYQEANEAYRQRYKKSRFASVTGIAFR